MSWVSFWQLGSFVFWLFWAFVVLGIVFLMWAIRSFTHRPRHWARGVIATILAVVCGLGAWSSFYQVSLAANDSSQEQVAALLTVNTVSEHCATSTDQNVVKYDIGALKGRPPRKWSDSISTPLNGGLSDVESAVCTDPLYGVTVANMLSSLQVDGVSVLSLNPWLKPFAANAGGINKEAAKFIPLLDVSNPSSTQISTAIVRNHAWIQAADRINTLLTRFSVAGVHTYASTHTWHLAAGGLQVGGLPAVSIDSRLDAKKALILEVTLKACSSPIARVGFNTGDKRPEVFTASTCETPTTPGSSTPTRPGSSKTPTGTPSTPGSTPTPTHPGSTPTPTHPGTHTPTPSCTPSPCGTCGSTPCVSKSSASQSPAAPPTGYPGVSTPPSAQPTAPNGSPAPTTGGYDNGPSTPTVGSSPDPAPSQSVTKQPDPTLPACGFGSCPSS